MRSLLRISFLLFVTVCFSLICTNIGEAAVTLPWSTTYNCADWNQYSDPLNCDGLSKSGAWTTKSGHYEQITADANYPDGAGGKGQRHWIGDGQNNCSGSVKVNFNTPQPELWIRYYIRYQTGFKWASLGYQKLLYFDNGTLVEPHGWDSLNIYKGTNHLSDHGWWDTMYKYGPIDPATGHRISDGSWHCMEWHLRVSDGLGEAWTDGVKYLSVSGIDYGSDFTGFKFPENENNPNNGQDMYMDLDDLAISNTGPIGPLQGKGAAPPPPPPPPSPPKNLKIIP
jgi:hypothetical protein